MRIGERGRFRHLAVRQGQSLHHRFQGFGLSGTRRPPRPAAQVYLASRIELFHPGNRESPANGFPDRPAVHPRRTGIVPGPGDSRTIMKRRKPIEFEEGSGNIFADLGLEDAGKLYTRAQIGVHVFNILKDKKLKQRQIAEVLGIARPDVSHLMNGHFNRFTTDKLLDFLKRLDHKVKIEVSRRHNGELYQQVTFGPQGWATRER